MNTAFFGLKKAKAEAFCKALSGNQGSNIRSVKLHGKWQDRIFVIEKVSVSDRVLHEAIPDPIALTLSLPIIDDWNYYVRECARFGGSIAALYRKQKHFEIVGGHTIHAYHHVALCRYRGPWAGVPLTPSVTCPKCLNIAETAPKYRARYHPQAFS